MSPTGGVGGAIPPLSSVPECLHGGPLERDGATCGSSSPGPPLARALAGTATDTQWNVIMLFLTHNFFQASQNQSQAVDISSLYHNKLKQS